MENAALQEFVATRAGRARVTFGDVRRLKRDILPDGLSSRVEMELLIDLDAKLSRADPAWTEWLIEIVLDFARADDGDDRIEMMKSEGIAVVEESLAVAAPKLKRKLIRRIRSERELREMPLLASPEQEICDAVTEAGSAMLVEPLPLAA